jgi:Arc/MetJ family transcription regulator
MKRRTTIEIDDTLLARARKALGSTTTRATVEEALRRAADAANSDQQDRTARQRRFFKKLSSWVDLKVLGSEEMWR